MHLKFTVYAEIIKIFNKTKINLKQLFLSDNALNNWCIRLVVLLIVKFC